MLALSLAAASGAALIAARDRGRAPSLGAAALMTPWANMHGGFIFGLLLIGPFALEAVIEAPAGARLLPLRAWATFALAALAAALINPYGVDAFLLPFQLMSVENLSRISEWRPQEFSHVGTMELGLLTLFGLTLIRPLTMPPIRAALLITLVAMALQHSRHQVLLGILAPMSVARPIASTIGAGRAPETMGRIVRIAFSATAAAALAIGAARLMAPIEPTDGATAPISALNAVSPELREKPVLNDYAFGGHLIFEHVRPFIDGRAELYRDPMLSLYERFRSGDVAAAETTLARYDIAGTIFAPDSRIVAVLDHERGWRRLYSEATAVVRMRDTASEGQELSGD